MPFQDEQIAELEAEIARLRDLLRPPPSSPDWRAPAAMGLTDYQSAILRHFVLHPGQFRRVDQLVRAVSPTSKVRPERLALTAATHISRLRRILPRPALIETRKGHGYRLTVEGAAAIERARLAEIGL
jgi:DNA-binding winged helix-turn-helix (wHTH) protein